MCRKPKGFTLVELLITIAIIGVIASIVIPTLIAATDRSRQKRTMADMRTIAHAIESYTIDNSFYPSMPSEADLSGSVLETALAPVYIQRLPVEDGWGVSLRYSSDRSVYTTGSLGKDGTLGGSLALSGSGGPTNDYDCDIIFSGGSFLQWPEGVQTD